MTKFKKPVALAVGAAIAGSLAVGAAAHASAFSATDLGQGYVTADAEGSCGGKKPEEGKCGADKKGEEGKCGEGKCGADKKGEEGKCGADKKPPEKPPGA